MIGWWIAGCIAAAVLALASSIYRQRGAEQMGLNLLRSQVEAWLSAPQTPVGGPTPRSMPPTGPQSPDGTTVLDSPTEGTPTPRGVGAVRAQNSRVVLGDPRTLSTTLSPGWRFQ